MLRYAFVFFAFIAPLQAVDSNETPIQSNVFIEADKGYKITFPSHWNVQRNFMGLDVFASAQPKNNQTGVVANISVVSSDLPENLSEDEFYSENIKSLEHAFQDFKVIETGVAAFDGFKARKIVYKHTAEKIHLRVAQYFFVQHRRGYIITCGADDKDFADYAETFEKSIKTFKVL